MLLRRVLCRLGAQRTLVAFRTLVCMVADCVKCKDAAEQKSFLQTTPDPTGGCLLGMMARPNSRALQAAIRLPQTPCTKQLRSDQARMPHETLVTADDLPANLRVRKTTQTHLKARPASALGLTVL